VKTDHAAGCIEVPAVVLNLGALINRDLDLPMIVSQFIHRRDQLTYAACDLGAAYLLRCRRHLNRADTVSSYWSASYSISLISIF
jgi:hypothetical protein